MALSAGAEAMSADAPLRAEAAAWLEQLRTQRGCSPRTLASYRFDLQALERVLDGRPWAALDEAGVRRWVAGAAREGRAPRSLARRLSCWRSFYDWLGRQGQGLIPANPVRGVRAPRAPRRLPKALSPDLAVRWVGFEAGEALVEQRDKAILELLYSSGLRLSELIGLDWRYVEEEGYRSVAWLDLEQAEAHVLGKGGKRRSVPIGREALLALNAWLKAREAWPIGPSGPGGVAPASADRAALFLGVRGGRIGARAVQKMVKVLAARQGLAVDVHPHVLRHSFASHLLQSSGDLRAVQELLGHASIATTQVYTSLDFQRLAAVYDAAHPRARRRD